MSFTVTNAFDALTDIKKNINNISNSQKIRMANFVNSQIYEYIIRINPEDYISDFTISVIANTFIYARPSDFKTMSIIGTGLFKTTTDTGYGLLNYDGQGATIFTVGLTVTGTISLATGVITEDHDSGSTGYLIIRAISGTFQDNETITDTSTGSATTNGTVTVFSPSTDKVLQRNYGSNEEGYYQKGTNFILTPIPTGTNIYVSRYIPIETALTVVGDNFINISTAGNKYLETIRGLLLVQYEIFNKDISSEVVAEQRANNILKDFFGSINNTPKIYNL
jgi:hypothetical protein